VCDYFLVSDILKNLFHSRRQKLPLTRHESVEHARAVRRQPFWDEQGNNARIRLAFLHEVAADIIPVRLRAWHQFRPFAQTAELNLGFYFPLFSMSFAREFPSGWKTTESSGNKIVVFL
jgi:hypothetical protein